MGAGADLAMQFEGYARELPNGSCAAYIPIPGDPWTIGFGSTGSDIGPSTIWTRLQATNRFGQTFEQCMDGVKRASPNVDGNHWEALSSFAYNCGIGAYQTSTLRRMVNQARWLDAANEFPKWCNSHGRKVSGLVHRRAAERALFLTPVVVTQTAISPTPVPVPTATEEPLLTVLWKRFVAWCLANSTKSRADDTPPDAKP